MRPAGAAPRHGARVAENRESETLGFLMFKKTTSPSPVASSSAGTPEHGHNPYLDARREWDERYGDALARATNWRRAAFAALAVALVAVVGIAHIGAQSKIEPYVIALGSMGSPIAFGMPSAASPTDQRIVEAETAEWLWNARTQLGDQAAQNMLLSRVFAMTDTATANYLNTWYAAHPPFTGATVKVDFTSFLPLGALTNGLGTYEATWIQTRSQANSSQTTSSEWKADVTVARNPKIANNPQVMLANPLGLYIKSVTWTRIIGSSGAASSTSAAGNASPAGSSQP